MSEVARRPHTRGRRSWLYRRRALLTVALVLPAVVIAALAEPRVPLGTWEDALLASLGWLAFAAGTGLRFWATLYIGGRKRNELVTQGPYSACRNPLYLGTLLVLLSAALFLGSWVLLVAVAVAAIGSVLGPIRAEENDLRELYGASFEAYVGRVPRLLPRWAGFATPPTIRVRVHGLALELRRALVWTWIPLATRLLVHLRAEPWWPRWIRWA